MPDFDEPTKERVGLMRESYYVFAIVNTDAVKDERILAVEKTRAIARRSIDAGEWAHIPGRLRIRRGKLALFES